MGGVRADGRMLLGNLASVAIINKFLHEGPSWVGLVAGSRLARRQPITIMNVKQAQGAISSNCFVAE